MVNVLKMLCFRQETEKTIIKKNREGIKLSPFAKFITAQCLFGVDR